MSRMMAASMVSAEKIEMLYEVHSMY
jgi:hypothetical protein